MKKLFFFFLIWLVLINHFIKLFIRKKTHTHGIEKGVIIYTTWRWCKRLIATSLSGSVPRQAQPEVDFISNPLLLQKSLYMVSESQENFAGGSRIQLKILMSVTVVPAYSEAHSCSSRICACIWSTFLPLLLQLSDEHCWWLWWLTSYVCWQHEPFVIILP